MIIIAAIICFLVMIAFFMSAYKQASKKAPVMSVAYLLQGLVIFKELVTWSTATILLLAQIYIGIAVITTLLAVAVALFFKLKSVNSKPANRKPATLQSSKD